MNTSDFKSFHYLENGQVVFSNFTTLKSTNKLAPGSYKITYKYNREEIVIFQDRDAESAKEPIYFIQRKEIESYLKSFSSPKTREIVNSRGFYLKGGMLLYGKEGGGKTSISKYYYNKLINEEGAVVFHMDQSNTIEEIWTFITQLRGIQDNLFVIMLDEIDKYMSSYEAVVKSILDGNLSLDNCFFIGVTNYIDSIPDAIKNRPSRFKYCIEIEGIQSIDIIEQLITKMIGDMLKTEEIKELALSLKGETLDTIKHQCLNMLMEVKQEKKIKKEIGFKV